MADEVDLGLVKTRPATLPWSILLPEGIILSAAFLDALCTILITELRDRIFSTGKVWRPTCAGLSPPQLMMVDLLPGHS